MLRLVSHDSNQVLLLFSDGLHGIIEALVDYPLIPSTVGLVRSFLELLQVLVDLRLPLHLRTRQLLTLHSMVVTPTRVLGRIFRSLRLVSRACGS